MTHGTFEVKFEGLCMKNFGAVELDEKIDMETVFLEHFVAMEECEAVNDPRIKTVSITKYRRKSEEIKERKIF